MGPSLIPSVELSVEGGPFAPGAEVAARVRFSVQGGLREAFTEGSWTRAYEKFDNVLKVRYGVRVQAGGLKRRTLGEVDSYRKASLFWTRNPKLVNAMVDKRIWVQVAKNFEPHVPLTEDGVRQELLDFDETVRFGASELGPGEHGVTASAFASWQKHDYTEAERVEARSAEARVSVG